MYIKNCAVHALIYTLGKDMISQMKKSRIRAPSGRASSMRKMEHVPAQKYPELDYQKEKRK